MEEEEIRRLIVSGVIAVVAPFAIANAQAMTISAPAGLAAVVHETSPLEDVAYRCRGGRCWHTGYGYRGYGYRGYGYGRYYRGYRGYAYNPCGRGWSVQDGRCKPYRGY
jgi:hypothetical protein